LFQIEEYELGGINVFELIRRIKKILEEWEGVSLCQLQLKLYYNES
jgi:hypothetical protein